jgi:succinate dehydrogenase / fumarate reductase, cytochrome b subunit
LKPASASQEKKMTPAPRPLSPHLQIYKPQLTSVLSITHRLTGIILSIGSLFLAWWLLAAATSDAAYASAQQFWGSWFGILLLVGWTFALFFHLANGVRHLVWDAGYGFTLREAYLSGWIVLAASAALTLIAWIAGLVAWVPR